MYVRQLALLQLLLWASYRHFIHLKGRFHEALLQTCYVDVVSLVMYCMCIHVPALIVVRASYVYMYVYAMH